MTEYAYGLLHGVDQENRVLAIKSNRRIKFFYLARGMFASFMDYFRPGIYVYLHVNTQSKSYRGYRVQNVVNIDKVLAPRRQRPTVYYDVSLIKAGIRTIVNAERPKLFLDFEMSMPPFRNYENFVSEIIQIGLVLTDHQGGLLEPYTAFIKPKLHPISERTERFLKVTKEEIASGVAYEEIHDLLARIQSTFKPMVFIWGKNDEIELGKMNRLYNLGDFTRRMQFIDLLKMHKTYFGLKNDLGLFNAYNMYAADDLDKQKHDALQDALVTMKVFFWFREVANDRLEVALPTGVDG